MNNQPFKTRLKTGDTVLIKCALKDDEYDPIVIPAGALGEVTGFVTEPECPPNCDDCELCPHFATTEHPKCLIDFDYAGLDVVTVHLKKTGYDWWIGQTQLVRVEDLL